MDEKFYEDLKEKIQPYFREGGSHAFDHVQRVYDLALKISEGEDVDLDVVKVSALLHDIAILKQDNGECKDHAEEGAKIAKIILEEMNFPEEKIELVCKCILFHNKEENLPGLKELRILKEADGLEGTGAIGIARIFSYGGEKNPWNSLLSGDLFKLFKRQTNSDYFTLPIANKLAKERVEIMNLFYNKFIKECNGEI